MSKFLKRLFAIQETETKRSQISYFTEIQRQRQRRLRRRELAELELRMQFPDAALLIDHLCTDFIGYSKTSNAFIYGTFSDGTDPIAKWPDDELMDHKGHIDNIERSIFSKGRNNLSWERALDTSSAGNNLSTIEHGYQYEVIDAERIFSVRMSRNDFSGAEGGGFTGGAGGGVELLEAKVFHDLAPGFLNTALANHVVKRHDVEGDPIICNLSIQVQFVDWGNFYTKRFRQYYITGSYLTGNPNQTSSRIAHFQHVAEFLAAIEPQIGWCGPMNSEDPDYHWREFDASRLLI